MYNLIFSKIADLDIDQSYTYIKDTLEAPTAAEKLFSEIYEVVEDLQKNPYKRALIQDKYLASFGIRSVNVKKYVLYYMIDENKKEINIIRFLHQLRDRINIIKGSLDDIE